MNPTSLPEEVAEQIFILLPVKDILSCCLVSSSWRDAVNKNIIWRKHCRLKINLEKLKCLVKPSFQVPQSDCENLIPICEYRQKYMQENHVRNNFRNNRCVEYQFSTYKYVTDIAFIDKYIVLSDTSDRMIYVWDIERKPFLVQSVQYLLKGGFPSTFKTFCDCLLIVHCTLLQIYEMVEGKLSLKMCRVLEREEAFSHAIPEADSVSEWYDSHFELLNPNDKVLLDVTIVGKYIILIVQYHPLKLNRSVMHIWDFESGKKLKKEPIPEVSGTVQSIHFGENSEYLYILLYISGSTGFPYTFLSYDPKQLQFNTFCVTKYSPYHFEDKFVVVYDWRNCWGTFVFLNSITGENIFEKRMANFVNPTVKDAYNAVMVIGLDRAVTVVDLSTQEVLTLDVNFDVHSVHLLDFDMLFVSGLNVDSSEHVSELWDLKANCRLCTLPAYKEASLHFRRGFPMLCFQNNGTIHIMHYW